MKYRLTDEEHAEYKKAPLSPLPSGWLRARTDQARPGALQLDLTVNAEGARGRQEIVLDFEERKQPIKIW